MKEKTMRLIIALSSMGLIFLWFIGIPRCDRTQEQKQQDIDRQYDSQLTTVNYRGHSYILYTGYKQGGIVHDPDCPCREKGGKYEQE